MGKLIKGKCVSDSSALQAKELTCCEVRGLLTRSTPQPAKMSRFTCNTLTEVAGLIPA